MHILETISHGINVLGIMIIIWGIVLALLAFGRNEFKRFQRAPVTQELDRLRSNLGGYLLLGLEFMVAGDIISTIIEPNYERLTILGGIVAIRTVISYFVGKEREQILQKAHHAE